MHTNINPPEFPNTETKIWFVSEIESLLNILYWTSWYRCLLNNYYECEIYEDYDIICNYSSVASCSTFDFSFSSSISYYIFSIFSFSFSYCSLFSVSSSSQSESKQKEDSKSGGSKFTFLFPLMN